MFLIQYSFSVGFHYLHTQNDPKLPTDVNIYTSPALALTLEVTLIPAPLRHRNSFTWGSTISFSMTRLPKHILDIHMDIVGSKVQIKTTHYNLLYY